MNKVREILLAIVAGCLLGLIVVLVVERLPIKQYVPPIDKMLTGV